MSPDSGLRRRITGAELARVVVYLTIALALLAAQYLIPGVHLKTRRYEGLVLLVLVMVVGYIETRVYRRKRSSRPPEGPSGFQRDGSGRE